jgi:succinoglycan biosynthesis transport protein ExoP
VKPRPRATLGNGTEQLPALARVESGRTDVGPAHDSFLDYWDILFAHRKTLVVFALTGLIAAVLIGLAQTPRYRARTSLEIQNANDNFLGLNTVDPTVTGVDFPTGPSNLQTQVVMLQSDTLLERVIDTLHMQESRPARFPGVRRMLGLSGSPRILTKDELIRQAKADLTVRVARDTRVLEILYESKNPAIAADFANSLVSEFIEQSQTMRLKAFQRTAERLTVHLSQMKKKLEQTEAQLQDYVRTSGLTFTSEKDNVSDVRLMELQAELSKAQADRIAKEARVGQAKKTSAEALPEMLDDPTLREYRLRLTDLQRELVELTATLTPAHYKVQRVQAQIKELQSAVQNQGSLTLSRIGSEYAAARHREEFLAKAYEEQQKIVTDQSGKGIRYRTLKGEVDSTRQLYESMLESVKQAELATTMRASNVLVIDVAKVPTRRHSPSLPMNAAVGVFGGVFLGLGFVFFRETVDRRIQAPGEARVYLNVSELGVIVEDAATPSRQIDGNGQTHPGFALLPAGHRHDRSELTAWNRTSSLSADSYRTIATSILLANQDKDNPRVVVVTSPCQGDGKTTVASNLSLAVVEIGRKVLLIDADLRRPGLHKLFGLSNAQGLSDLLHTNTPLDQLMSIEQLLCETKISGLHVLPAGGSIAHSASVLHSRRMSALLERLRGEFDMVIVDTPPVLPVPDARVLGRLADGIILVLRAGQTTIENALIARQRFAEDGTRVLGTILNGWNPKTGRRYGYGGYYGAYES